MFYLAYFLSLRAGETWGSAQFIFSNGTSGDGCEKEVHFKNLICFKERYEQKSRLDVIHELAVSCVWCFCRAKLTDQNDSVIITY